MNAAAAGRSRLLLAVLLVLLGLTVAPGSGVGSAAPHRTTETCEQASATPPMHGDRHGPLRLSATAPQAFTSALPSTWWAVCQPATYGYAPTDRSSLGEAGHTGLTAATPTRQSSRAPPRAV